MSETRLSCLHTHTTYDDGEHDIEAMCRAAYEKQLVSIGFSAHAPINKQSGIKTFWHLSEDRLDEYIEEILAAKRRWEGKLAVYLGLEVDYIKGLRSAADSDIRALNLDYIIGSVHYLVPANGAEPFTVDGPFEELEKGLNEGFNGDWDALMNCYYDATAEMIRIGGFDILGHADLIKKNCHGKNYWNAETEIVRQREIARAAMEAGITAEVNTGGINRKKINDVYPSLPFLRFFLESKVPVIITADAHKAADIDGNYDTALQALISADITEHSLFLGKINGKTVWQKEKIY